MSQQPEALHLADSLGELDAQFTCPGLCGEASAELRRLHAIELEADALRAQVERLQAAGQVLVIKTTQGESECTNGTQSTWPQQQDAEKPADMQMQDAGLPERKARALSGEAASYRDENDMPTETAVLRREWIAMRHALSYRPTPQPDPAPVAAVPAMVQLTEDQMISAVRPLCNTGQVAERLVAVSIDEYRAIEAAIAKINGLTVGDGGEG